MVLAHFGNPSQIAQGFAWVYRHERRAFQIFAFTLSAVFLAASLFAAILALQAWLAFSIGAPVSRVIASRHTLIEALDILASVSVYLGVRSVEGVFQNHRFEMAALLITTAVSPLIALLAAGGLNFMFLFYGLVIGVFFRAVQLFVPPMRAQLGLVVVVFPLAGLAFAVLRPPVSTAALTTAFASWLAMGLGYQLITHIASRVDMAVLNRLEGRP